jgi:hypothetical protein
MRKSEMVSDVKNLIKEAKTLKQCEHTSGMLEAYERVLNCIKNHGKPKRILPSRGLKLIKKDNQSQDYIF